MHEVINQYIGLISAIITILLFFNGILLWIKRRKNLISKNNKRVNETLTTINNLKFIKDKLKIVAFRNYSGKDGTIKVKQQPLNIDREIIDKGIEIANERKEYPNDNIAVVAYNENSIAKEGDITINFFTMRYSEYLAMKKYTLGLNYYILSVNSFIICEKKKILILHRRNKGSVEYTDLIHSFGGAYQPEYERITGDKNIRETLEREIKEEARFKYFIDKGSHMLLTDEHSIKFLQVGFLGVKVDKKELEHGETNWEGNFEMISFNKIEDRLCNFNDWAPSGWVKLMFWLGLNCPNLKRKRVFNNKYGIEVFMNVLNTIQKTNP